MTRRVLVLMVGVAGGCTDTSKDSGSRVVPSTTDTGRAQRPPTAPEVAIEPAAPISANDLTWRVVTAPTDPDGDSLTWSVAWAVDGVDAPDWTDTVSADATAKGQVWELRVSVTDGLFTSDTALEVVVIGNTPPEAAVVLTPEAPTTDDILRATPSGTDVDGDTLGYRIAWLKDGENTGITSLDVPAEQTRAGETWSVVVTPLDPEGSGTAATASVVIQNSVPVVTDLRIVPTRPDTTDTLTATFVGDDPDPGDILVPAYTWTVDGVEAGTDAELAGGRFVRGQEVGLSIALNDGTVTGPTRTAEPVVVGNATPEVLEAVLDPASPAPGDTVTCGGVGWFDADYDPEGYQYIWSLDGESGPTVDHYHLSSTAVVGGETLTCILVPDDGIDVGTSVSVSTTITTP